MVSEMRAVKFNNYEVLNFISGHHHNSGSNGCASVCFIY